jgi:hypothetical protein
MPTAPATPDSINGTTPIQARTPLHHKANGAAKPEEPPTVTEIGFTDIDRTARELLQDNPDALTATGHQTVIPVVKKTGQFEFFRTDPTVRLTMPMVVLKKGGDRVYAVMPAAIPCLARVGIEPFLMTLYPVVIKTRPLSDKLVWIKLPSGRDWEPWTLSRRRVLDEAVGAWKAMRIIGESYGAFDPGPKFISVEPVFPDYTEAEWIDKSLKAADLIIRDDAHPLFEELGNG